MIGTTTLIPVSCDDLVLIKAGKLNKVEVVADPQPVFDGKFWTLYGAGWSGKDADHALIMPCHSLEVKNPIGKLGDWIVLFDGVDVKLAKIGELELIRKNINDKYYDKWYYVVHLIISE